MTKADLINVIAEKGEYTKKDADKALSTVISAISDSLAKGEKIQLIGFGTFEVREIAERTGRNPATGKEIKIPACKKPAFKVGQGLKNALN